MKQGRFMKTVLVVGGIIFACVVIGYIAFTKISSKQILPGIWGTPPLFPLNDQDAEYFLTKMRMRTPLFMLNYAKNGGNTESVEVRDQRSKGEPLETYLGDRITVEGEFIAERRVWPCIVAPCPSGETAVFVLRSLERTPPPTNLEKASGIIKSVYSKSGRNYIDIDYVELNPSWTPGGMSGNAYQNNDPKIRTFEISPNAKFVVGSPATVSITFSEFQKLFATTPASYKAYNPWTIVVVDGVVVNIGEHFFP